MLLRGGPSIGPNSQLLERVGVDQDALVSVLPRVGADIGDQKRWPPLKWHVGQFHRPRSASPPVAATLGKSPDSGSVRRPMEADRRCRSPEFQRPAGGKGKDPDQAAGQRFVVSDWSASVVGTSRCRTSVNGCRLVPTTSLPMSANPMALISNASRLCCSSTDCLADAGGVLDGLDQVRGPRRRRR